MPRVPVPPEVDEFLRLPNPAVVATLRADGSPHTVPTWYDWEDGRVLLNMDESRLRLGHLRRDPRAALTVLGGGEDGWYRHVVSSATSARSSTTTRLGTSTALRSATPGSRSARATASE